MGSGRWSAFFLLALVLAAAGCGRPETGAVDDSTAEERAVLLSGEGEAGAWRLEAYTTDEGSNICYDVVYAEKSEGQCGPLGPSRLFLPRPSPALLYAGEDVDEGLIFGHVNASESVGTPVRKVRLTPTTGGPREDVSLRDAEVGPLPEGRSLRFFAVKTSVAFNDWTATGIDDSGREWLKANVDSQD